MAAGETYTVPADAQNPQILTGRPQALRVTIGGKEVAPLGPADRTITDVGISAAALNARPAPAAPDGTQQPDGGWYSSAGLFRRQVLTDSAQVNIYPAMNSSVVARKRTVSGKSVAV